MSFKENALYIIGDLLETINWLGGDTYEMESIEKSTKDAHDFINQHKPPEKDEPELPDNVNNGLYCLRNDELTTVKARNKRYAATELGVGKQKVRCLVEPPKWGEQNETR